MSPLGKKKKRKRVIFQIYIQMFTFFSTKRYGISEKSSSIILFKIKIIYMLFFIHIDFLYGYIATITFSFWDKHTILIFLYLFGTLKKFRTRK